MRLLLLTLCATLSLGCAGSFEEARVAGLKTGASGADAGRCKALDDAQAVWGAMAKGTAALAGGSALAPLVEEVRDDQTGRIVAASVAGGAAAISAFSAHMAGVKGESWARECSAGR